MAAPGKPKSLCGITLKPLTQENLLFYYAPIVGAGSYATLSVKLANPNLLRRLFPTRDITNTLLATSIAGTALYIYRRPHLDKVSNQLKITYSVYNSTLMSLGSILLWTMLRFYLPENAVILTASCVGTGIGILILGKDYLELVDKK